MRLFIMFACIVLCCSVAAQKQEVTFEIQSIIQKVELRDTFLVRQIEKFISEAKKSDTDFNQYGYVKLVIARSKYKGQSTLKSYWIVTEYGSFDNDENDNIFPLYYAFVSGKLVTVILLDFSPIIRYRFSAEEKKNFQAIAEPFLFPKPDQRRNTIATGGGTHIWIFYPPKAPIVMTAKEAGIY